MSATQRDESDRTESDGAEPEPEGAEPEAEQYIDEQEEDSFPASDPHSDWSGPPEPD